MIQRMSKTVILCSKLRLLRPNYRFHTKLIRRFSSEKKENDQKYIQQVPQNDEVLQGPEQLDQKIQQQIIERMNLLQAEHKKQQQIIDQKIKFPIKLCGTKDRYEKRYSYLPERIMGYYRLSHKQINSYLLNMYKASLYSIADKNTKYMDQYWEQGLKISVLECLDKAKSQNYSIKVQEDHSYLQDIQQSCQVIDSVMFRGLSIDRNQNKAPNQYIKYSESDDIGLITYTPKNITQNGQDFIDPNKNKKVYDGYERMILRLLVRIKSPLRINIKQFNVSDDIYTWQHICVFQNQMVAPKHLQSRYKLETLMEWLGKYRFGQWRVADIDNFMYGNSPFRNHYPPQQQIDPVFKGTKMDKSYYIDIRKL